MWGCVDCRAFYGVCTGCGGDVWGLGDYMVGVWFGVGGQAPAPRHPATQPATTPTRWQRATTPAGRCIFSPFSNVRSVQPPPHITRLGVVFGGGWPCNDIVIFAVSPKTRGANRAEIPLATQSPSPEIKESAPSHSPRSYTIPMFRCYSPQYGKLLPPIDKKHLPTTNRKQVQWIG